MKHSIQLFKVSILRIFLPVVLAIALFTPTAKADHIIGSDISYVCSGKNDSTWKIIFNFYRDCNGCFVLSQSPKCGTSENCASSQTAPTNLTVRCATGGTAGTAILKRTSITDITKTCKSVKSRCQQPCNGTYPYGIEKHTFEGTLDLRSMMRNGCCEFEISVTLYVRNVGITTGQSQQSFYTSCELNACLDECNSSPALTNDPVAILCCNQPYVFNNGAVDTSNYDSISYSFAPAFRGANQQCSYSGGRSPQDPISTYYPSGLKFPYSNANSNPPIGTYLDKKNGDIIFTPIKCDEVAVVVMEMTEWRKDSKGVYKKIGATRRDMQFIVTRCPDNNPPTITNTKFSYTVCEGQQVCFNVTTDDKVFVPPPPAPRPDPDTVQLKWNRGIPGATFVITNPTQRLKTGQFCWTPPVGAASSLPYSFTATVTDDACPMNASATRSFQIFVNPKAQAKRIFTKLPCGRYAVESEIFPNFREPARYQWQLLDSNQRILFDRHYGYFEGNGSFLSTKEKDTILFRRGGKYIIQHTITNAPNCPTVYYDTIIIPPLLEVDIAFGPDTFVCAGTSLRLSPDITNGSMPITYKWGTGATTDYLDVRMEANNPDSSFYVEIKDGNGCTAWDSTHVYLRDNPVVTIGPDRRICDYDSIFILPKRTLAYWNDPRDTSDSLIQQGDTLFNQWYFNGTPYGTDSTVKTNIAGQYVLMVSDSLGCRSSDTMNLIVNDHVEALAGLNQTICWNDKLTLIARGLDTVNNAKSGTYRWYDYTAPPVKDLGTKDTLSFNLKVSSNYRLGLWVTEDTVTCFDDDSVSVKVNPLPVLNMPANKSICCDAGVVNLRLDENPKGGTWSCSANPSYVSSGYLFQTQLACGTNRTVNRVTYTYVDPSTACVNRDSFTITVNPLPRVILRNGYFCQDKEIVNLASEIVSAPGNLNLGTQTWNCIDCGAYDWSKILFDLRGGVGFPEYVLRIDENNMPLSGKAADTIVIELVYRSGDGCYNRDTSTIAVTRVPKISFSPFRELCWDEGKVDLKVMSNVNPNDGHWAPYDTTIFGYIPYNTARTAFSGSDLTGDTVNTMLLPAAGGRVYMRYLHTRSGCPTYRDTTLIINPLPRPNIDESVLDLGYPSPPYLFCETNPDVNMLATPAGGTWSSPYSGAVVGRAFKPTASPTGTPFFIQYRFVDTKGCRGSDSVQVLVEALPVLDIISADTQLCRSNSMSVPVRAQYSNTTGITWIPLTGGSVDNNKATQVRFSFTANNDSTNRHLLYVQTEPGNACPFVDDVFTVSIHPIPELQISADRSFGCNPVSSNFTSSFLNRIDANASTYAWDFGDGGTDNTANPSYVFTQNGANTVSLNVRSEHGCDTTVNITIDVYPNPVANFTPNPNNSTTAALPRFSFQNGSTVQNVLNASIVRNSWDFGDPNSTDDTSSALNPVHFYPADTGMYFVTLKVQTIHGCRDSITKNVIIGPDILVFIPNAFSPDGGGPGENEGFRAKVNNGVQDYHLIVFNRWGEILWESLDPSEKWDGTYKGTPVQPGVYAWKLNVTSWNNEAYRYSGTVILLK
ncbi:MAG: gliding motility-associated C-terminal domain-containing protein [Flavobacteriales bacterium]|nr:gliding motility-associated C-terminal domain-containing protein [Flavobacteriales bacterium]